MPLLMPLLELLLWRVHEACVGFFSVSRAGQAETKTEERRTTELENSRANLAASVELGLY